MLKNNNNNQNNAAQTHSDNSETASTLQTLHTIQAGAMKYGVIIVIILYIVLQIRNIYIEHQTSPQTAASTEISETMESEAP